MSRAVKSGRAGKKGAFGKHKDAKEATRVAPDATVQHSGFDHYDGYGWVKNYLITSQMPNGPQKKAIRARLFGENASCFWHAVLTSLFPDDAEWFFGVHYPWGTGQGSEPVDVVLASRLAESFDRARGRSFGMILVDITQTPEQPDFQYCVRHGYTLDHRGHGVAVVKFDDNYELKPHWVPFQRALAKVWNAAPVQTLQDGQALRSIPDLDASDAICARLELQYDEHQARVQLEGECGSAYEDIANLSNASHAKLWRDAFAQAEDWEVLPFEPQFTLGRAEHKCPVEKGYVEHVKTSAPTGPEVDLWQWNARLAGWAGLMRRAIYGAIYSHSDGFMTFINGSEVIEATDSCLVGAWVRPGTWIYSRVTDEVLYDQRKNAEGAWRVDRIAELVGKHGKIWLGTTYRVTVQGVTYSVRPLNLKRTWLSRLRQTQDKVIRIVPDSFEATLMAGPDAVKDPEAFCRYTMQIGTLLLQPYPEMTGPFRDIASATLSRAKDLKREDLNMIPLGQQVARTAEALKAAGALAGATLPK